MKYNKTLALVPAILLAACGGSDEQTMSERSAPGSVVYSFPMDGQADVSPKTELVLRFSHAITDDEATLREKISISSGDTSHDFTVEKIDGGKSLKLQPASRFDILTRYSVTFEQPLAAEGGRTVATPNAVGEPGIQFDTRGDFTAIANLTNTDETFQVAWQVPDQGSAFQAMNFSTFRLAMTHPVHPDWKKLGGTIELLDSDNQAVPATVLVKGNRITVDPCVTADPEDCGSKADVLEAGQTYTLKLNNLTSLTNGPDGDRFSQEFSFQPRDTGPTVVLQQAAVDSGLGEGASEDAAQRSILNGQIINGVTLNSVLQGVAGPSQQTGDLFAELAYAPAFRADEALPLRVPKGSVLNSTSLDVRIGGEVPILNAATGQLQTTGNIKVTMLSDASGYLSPNPYTDDLNAPRHITLFMDVSMNTEEAQPNASLSQDLMGVELRGIALVQNGVLTIDAIGMVEPNLLGQEFTDSTIAFHLQAATDVDSVLDADAMRELDTTSPQLVSWMPGPENAIPDTRQAMQRPGDPVILNFDEPLDPATAPDGVTLFEAGTVVENLHLKVDGTTLTINPEGGLKHGLAYRVSPSGLSDLAGNPAIFQDLKFVMTSTGDNDDSVTKRSPIALTTYPGFPCVTNAADFETLSQGQCLDAAPNGPAGDVLPIADMPTDRPIIVVFSQSMRVDTINSETLVVEKVSDPATAVGAGEIVSGRIEKNNQRIRFFPDQPWEPGSFYRYTLHSSTAVGDCAQAICSDLGPGYPLKTDLLVNPEAVGGPDMTIYFRGAESIASVFTPLRNLPVRDTNSNFEVDCPTLGDEGCLEPFEHESDGMGGFLPSANAAKLIVKDKQATVLGAPAGAAVGCAADTEGDCPRNKFIYQTYGLNTEVVGPAIDPETNKTGVKVLLYPTMLVATSATVVLDGLGDQVTGPQVLRMRYSEGAEGRRDQLIEGIIIEDANGGPIFKTTAELTLDAPNLSVPLEGALQHNLYSLPITLNLDGPITFFDDGRMQIEQRNNNAPDINVLVSTENAILDSGIELISCLGGLLFGDTSACENLLDESSEDTGAVLIPLTIPEGGIYLNFISNPIKELPIEQ
jgi:hypothetical protein